VGGGIRAPLDKRPEHFLDDELDCVVGDRGQDMTRVREGAVRLLAHRGVQVHDQAAVLAGGDCRGAETLDPFDGRRLRQRRVLVLDRLPGTDQGHAGERAEKHRDGGGSKLILPAEGTDRREHLFTGLKRGDQPAPRGYLGATHRAILCPSRCRL
jgi:hypothetical protein